MANARTFRLVILLFSLSAGAAMAQDQQQRLAEALKRFPKADANGDGILSIEEARAFLQKRKANRSKAKGDFVAGRSAALPADPRRWSGWAARDLGGDDHDYRRIVVAGR